mmetsp:Transcript_50888/g.51295  ORF Transcript_50888/g.51295 Transcript_50888/m.51295 type:complete len:92 (+) Transcript_50888:369-644(+)
MGGVDDRGRNRDRGTGVADPGGETDSAGTGGTESEEAGQEDAILVKESSLSVIDYQLNEMVTVSMQKEWKKVKTLLFNKWSWTTFMAVLTV